MSYSFQDALHHIRKIANDAIDTIITQLPYTFFVIDSKRIDFNMMCLDFGHRFCCQTAMIRMITLNSNTFCIGPRIDEPRFRQQAIF